jgi:uncharacterized membrane-anchored protein
MCLYMEEVAVHAGHEVLMEVGNNSLLIVGDPMGISDQQLRPRPFLLLNIPIIKLYNINISDYLS